MKEQMPLKETFEQRRDPSGRGEASWMDAGQSVREQVHYICETARLGRHRREMAFLSHLMQYDDTSERHELEQKIAHVESKERSARRAVWLMVVLMALALVGLGYSAILLEDFPQNKTQLVMRIFYALGAASLVSLLAFAGFWMICLGDLNEQRESCRRFVTRIMESRLGKPVPDSLRIVRIRSPRNGVAADDHKPAEGRAGGV